VGEKFGDIQRSEKYPRDGLYYNQRNKLWYSVGYVKNEEQIYEKKVLARHKNEDQCVRLSNKKKVDKIVEPCIELRIEKFTNLHYNTLEPFSNENTVIKITHYGMRYDKTGDNYKSNFTPRKGQEQKHVFASKNYWKCVTETRNIIEKKN
jgi:hypothetical protein